jgi:uncharacterized membrane protein YdjX (TVP38/TMEM64 family)
MSGKKDPAVSINVSESYSNRSNWKKVTIRTLTLLAVIGICILVFNVREHADQFAVYGYPGIFLTALLAYATVLLPAPGTVVVFTMGGMFNPFGVALAAATGAALGELTGYMAGFSGQAIIDRTDIYKHYLPIIQKYGVWAILILAAVPNPFFDLAGIAAGVTKIPIWRFLLFCWIGQIIKMMVFAYAGHFSIDWISNLIS